MIDELYTRLSPQLEPTPYYLGSEHLDEKYAAPKIVLVPEGEVFSLSKQERVDVTFDAALLPSTITPDFASGLTLTFFCYGRGPGYNETEVLWRRVVAAAKAESITYFAAASSVRYSTDIPQAYAHRVAVLTLAGIATINYTEPTLARIDTIQKTVAGTEASGSAGATTVTLTEVLNGE